MDNTGVSIAYKVLEIDTNNIDICDEQMIAQQSVGNIPISKVGNVWLFETYNNLKISDGIVEDLGIVGGRQAWKMFRPFSTHLSDYSVLKQYNGKLFTLISRGQTWGEHILPGDMLELCDSEKGIVCLAGKVEFTKQSIVSSILNKDIKRSFSARMYLLNNKRPKSNTKFVKAVRNIFNNYDDADVVTVVGFSALSTTE